MRGKGNAAFLKGIMELYIKYPLQSLGATLIIVIILNLYNHQEYVEPILFTIIFGGGLLLLAYIGYHYFIKTKNSAELRNKEFINQNKQKKKL